MVSHRRKGWKKSCGRDRGRTHLKYAGTANRLRRGKCYELTFMRPSHGNRTRKVKRGEGSLAGKAEPEGHVTLLALPGSVGSVTEPHRARQGHMNNKQYINQARPLPQGTVRSQLRY